MNIIGFSNYHLIFHSIILNIFSGKDDGYLGIFFLSCILYDSLIIWLVFILIRIISKSIKQSHNKNYL